MRFVLIDRLEEIEPGRRAVGLKVFLPGEELFRDHFPGDPIVPGVLLTEAMGQVGGWLLAAGCGFTRWPLLSLIDRSAFFRQVRPGEQIRSEAVVRAVRGDDAEVRTVARVGETKVAEARLLFHLFEPPEGSSERSEAFREWTAATFGRLTGSLPGARPPVELRRPG
jgi:3-hydroxyacyl-[acyl-carrier-protein] dehydratase